VIFPWQTVHQPGSPATRKIKNARGDALAISTFSTTQFIDGYYIWLMDVNGDLTTTCSFDHQSAAIFHKF
jgi:hypothetical protein